MKRRHTALAGIATSALLLALVPATSATAGSGAAPPEGEPKGAHRMHDLPNPLGDAQRKLREEAVQQLITGEATTETRGGQRVIKVKGNKQGKGKKKGEKGKDRYVSYPVNREEAIFTILSEFGDQVHPVTGGTPGPLHNQIEEPDRDWDGDATDDNSTIWQADYDRDHYMDLMFGDGESFKDFFLKQSNGRFMSKGDVSNWVKVPYNEARYGSNKISDAQGAWPYIRDTATAWFESQKAAGKSDAEIKEYLSQFDKVDRYDYDGDGNFNEPDGYIDHFQAIHAGEDESAGGGAQGEDAIWAHRWYAYSNNIGKEGPEQNKAGGVPLGNTGIWIGDYTTEPENGGLGVFAHEFAHDLGLPDYYDTMGGDNGTAFWTLMSGGSWLNEGKDEIGTKPNYMGPLEKLQLGWLDYTTATFGQDTSVKLGPADKPKSRAAHQALVVPLPDKTVTTEYNTPRSGSAQWWSGAGDDLQNTLTRSIDLTGKSSASVSAWMQHNIEVDYDYLRAEVSTDGGATWTGVGEAIDGPAGNEGLTDWAEHTWDLSAHAGSSIQFRLRFATDGGLHYEGAFIDDITITADGATLLSDDVESGDNGWTAKGFSRMSGTTSEQVSHFYLAENRTYTGYDRYLQTGPYNFGWSNTKPDWVERFPYQNGMLVWYVDGAYKDNNTSVHPGHGQSLPVDARPKPVTFPNGAKLGNRRQPFDATFGLEATDAVTFHRNGVPTEVPSQPAMPTFDDSDPNRYWDATNPWSSTKVAGTGTRLTVTKSRDGGKELQVKVDFR